MGLPERATTPDSVKYPNSFPSGEYSLSIPSLVPAQTLPSVSSQSARTSLLKDSE